jgi:hypothetical protein
VATIGGSVTSSGTACRCMFEPIKRAVGVVVLQERNQPGRHADHLAGRDVDVLTCSGRHDLEVAAVAGDHVRPAHELAVLDFVSAGAT